MEEFKTYISGWNTPEEIAQEIWTTSASILLRGDLLFGYRNSQKDKSVERLIIVYNFYVDQKTNKKVYTTIGLQMLTPTWGCLVPNVSYEYLETIVLKDLSDYKAEKEVIESLKLLISTLKNYGNK